MVKSPASPTLPFAHAAVVHANHFQFSPRQRITHRSVHSRMVCWCKAGAGRITVDRHSFDMDPGRLLVMPWGHSVSYHPASDDPFLLGGVHAIADCDPRKPLIFNVAHQPGDALYDHPSRCDIDIPALRQVMVSSLDDRVLLAHLLEYAVQLFMHQPPPEWLARQLGAQVLHELVSHHPGRDPLSPNLSMELERMQQFVRQNLHRPLSLQDLVEFSNLSASTVGRLFRRHVHQSPAAWIMAARMQRARQLLRTRRLPVAEVGRMVGMSDPYYFSKCFKRVVGMGPLAYRRAESRL